MAQSLAATPPVTGSLELSTEFQAHQVVVGVGGEVDLLTAPALRGLISSIIDGGHHTVVIDVSRLGFIDAAGLGVLAVAASRSRKLGGQLTVRNPSALLKRILELTNLIGLIALVPAVGPLQNRGRDRGHAGSAARPSNDLQPLGPLQASVLAAGNDVIDAALRLVTALTHATIGGADGVSVSLNRLGELTTVAASDDTIAQMDRDQYATGEGPCLSAAAEGHWIHVDSVEDEVRWPRFIPRARDSGIASILSNPLVVSGTSIGALNIYSNTAHAFGPPAQELAALFASQASDLLSEAFAATTVDQTTAQLRAALIDREVIAQAQGVLMARQGIGADFAHAALSRSARAHGITVRDQALTVLSSTLRNDLIGGTSL